MVVELPFEYAMFLAYKTKLQYESIRTINIKDLYTYIDTLIYFTLKDYNVDKNFIPNESWSGKITIYPFDYEVELPAFLANYGFMFEEEGEFLTLKEDITLEHIVSLLEEFDISARFSCVANYPEVLTTLNATSLRDFIFKSIEVEQTSYNEYMRLVSEKSSETLKEIPKLLLKRLLFINSIHKCDRFKSEALYAWAMNIYDYYDEESVYLKFPINSRFYEQSEYYDPMFNLSDTIYDTLQFAIFGSRPLASAYIMKIVEENYAFNSSPEEVLPEEEEEDSYEEYEDEDEETYEYNPHYLEEETAFYLKYIDKINYYLETYGNNSDLIKTKYRLLYCLDKPEWCLYKEDNFQVVLTTAMEYDQYDNSSFSSYADEAKYFITEIFGNHNGDSEITIIKKLLFISTYYELTKDPEIVDLLNAYESAEEYPLFSRIILDEGEGRIKRLIK